MGFSAITLPHQFMAAYSAVPLKVFDTDYDQVQQYKYIINGSIFVSINDIYRINDLNPTYICERRFNSIK